MIKAIPDEMVTTFAIAGTLREVRERVDALWRSSDSMTLAAPAVFVSGERLAHYQRAIAGAFYPS